MKKAVIKVPSMMSQHCQLRVKDGIDKLKMVDQLKIESGSIEVDFKDQNQLTTVQNEIEKLGYTVMTTVIQDVSESPEKTYQFKTNINCSGCVARIQPFLAEAAGVCHWAVDTDHADKILTVHSDGITEKEIMNTVERAGFKIESLKK